MDQNHLYNIRMHASSGERHISGAERIVTSENIDTTVQELIARARQKKNTPEQIIVTIESLGDRQLQTLKSLDVISLDVPDWKAGRACASQALQRSGVSLHAAESAIHYLSTGASPSGCTMRGAMIMDAQNGERLEPDQERGVRASRFDWSDDALKKIDHRLAAIGLKHYRTREALSLATKVAYGPGICAELCWSDEPDYVAGYVSTLDIGYVRFPFLKQPGDPNGGRVFFVDRSKFELSALISYLETETVLITDAGRCTSVNDLETHFIDRH
jgi:6-carboxyhexanoate--CoA ligase